MSPIRGYESVPKLLKIRWVCSICLKVIWARLEVSWRRELSHVSDGRENWFPAAITEPRHCGIPMLVLGEPKTDVHGLRGHGLVIDPLDDMRKMRARARAA